MTKKHDFKFIIPAKAKVDHVEINDEVLKVVFETDTGKPISGFTGRGNFLCFLNKENRLVQGLLLTY